MTTEPIDIRTGKPFTSRRQHLHHPPSDGASLGGSWGRARGLLGGCFTGCMMAAQREPSIWRYDGKMHFWYSLNDGNFNGGVVSFKFYSVSGTATVNWGDGTTSTMSGTTISHTYAAIGDYEVVVDGFATVKLTDYSWGNGNTQVVRIELGSPFAMVSGNWYHFLNLPALTRVNLNGYNLFVPSQCFTGSALMEAVDDAEFASIGYSAFNNCSSLTSVGDLSNCTSIGSYAFSKCVNLTTITATRVESLGNNAFDGCNNLREAHFSASYLRTIGSRCFSWYQGTGACYSLETVTGLDNVAQLGELTFTCESLQSIYMPSCTLFTGGENFRGCKRIRSITLGTMTSMGANNFIDCGILNSADADGIKCTITVGNTMQSWRDINGLQQDAPKTTKFVCADGYIVYENGAWTDHPNA